HENVDYLNRTPGDVPYQERLATTYDQVHTLIVTNKTSFLYKRSIRKFIHSSLYKAGIRPSALQVNLEMPLHHSAQTAFLRHVAFSGTSKYKPGRQEIFKINFANMGITSGIEISHNNLAHLLECQYQKHGLTKWEFLESSMKNFEMGKEVLSYSKNGVLQILVWFHLSNMGQNPGRCVVLQGLYCPPTSETLLMPFLWEVARLLSNKFSEESLYLISNRSNGKTLKKSGMLPEPTDFVLGLPKSV